MLLIACAPGEVSPREAVGNGRQIALRHVQNVKAIANEQPTGPHVSEMEARVSVCRSSGRTTLAATFRHTSALAYPANGRRWSIHNPD